MTSCPELGKRTCGGESGMRGSADLPYLQSIAPRGDADKLQLVREAAVDWATVL